MNKFCLILVLFICNCSWLAVAADAPNSVQPKSAKNQLTRKPHSRHAPTCSPEWVGILERECSGSTGSCYSMIDEARHLMESQRKIMTHVLVDSAEFVEVEKIWDRYSSAECVALEPQCPEGHSGSCNDPSAICEARLDCEHVAHLRATECRTNDYNRSLQAPPMPDTCY